MSPARRRWLVRGLVGMVVVWVISASVQLVLTYRDAAAAMDSVDRAEETLTPEGILEGAGAHHLSDARRRLERVDRRASGLLLWPVRHLPILGRQVEATASVAEAGGEIAAIGERALEDARTALDQEEPTGRQRVALLQRLSVVAGTAADDLARVDVGAHSALIGPLVDRRRELETKLVEATATLRDAEDVTAALADLLDGPSRYLLLAANNAEMRSGSGMFLSAGVMTLDGGDIELSEMAATGDLNLDEPVPFTDDDLADNWGWAAPNREWRNLGLTPRFDVNAELAARMWEARTGERVDGVLAVDVVALQAILAATGPVELDSLVLGEDNVVDYILREQYVAFDDDELVDERREQLGAVAEAAVEALEQGDFEMAELAEGIADAAATRHLLLWSRDADHLSSWVEVGIAGTLDGTELLVAVANRGANKLDPYLDVRSRLTTERRRDHVDVVLDVELENEAPDGLPQYVLGLEPSEAAPAGHYNGLVAISLPESAYDASFDGQREVAVAGPDGPGGVVATVISVAPGERELVRLRFRVVPGAEVSILSSARVPPVEWIFGDDEWTDDETRVVTLR